MIAGRKHPKLIVDNNEFTVNRRRGDRSMWKCSQYYRLKCKCRLVSYNNTVKISANHNHTPTYPNVTKASQQTVKIIRI